MQGWIKLDRKIQNHWIFKDPNKFQAWITILLEVNHCENKVLIKDTLLNVERGESVNSLDTWARKFGKNWTKSKVRRFFDLLEKDSMIVTKSETVTTRLSVCNYDSYQGERNANETQVKRKRNVNETQVTPNKNDNNSNNEYNEEEVIKPKPTKPKIEFIELGEFENIKIEKDKIENLKESYSADQIDWMIKKLGSWLVGKKKKVESYKSLKAYFVNWVERSYLEENTKNIELSQKNRKLQKIETENRKDEALAISLGLIDPVEPSKTIDTDYSPF